MAARADHAAHQSSQRKTEAVTSWKSASGTPFATKRGAQWEIAASTRGSFSALAWMTADMFSGSQRDEISRIVALPRPSSGFEGGGQRLDLALVEREIDRRHVLLEPLLLLRARDREDVGAAREQPRERDLRGSGPAFRRDRLDGFHELEVLLEIARPEARLLAPDVVRRDVVYLPDVSGEEASPERRVRDKTDAQLAARGQDLVLDVARPQRILGLQRGDRMDPGCALERLRPGLREAEIAHLAGLDQPRHRAHRLLDRHVRVDAVQVVEVDVVDAELREARLAGGAHVLGPAVGVVDVTELGADDDVVAPAFQRAAEHALVLALHVAVCGVEERDAQVHR